MLKDKHPLVTSNKKTFIGVMQLKTVFMLITARSISTLLIMAEIGTGKVKKRHKKIYRSMLA